MKINLSHPLSKVPGLISILILISAFLLAISCSSRVDPSQQITQPGSQIKAQPGSVAEEVWKSDWEKTLNSAKKEGIAVVYTSSAGPALHEASNMFKQKYGISLEGVSGRGAEVVRKVLTERKNGLFMVDAFVVGMNSNLEVKISGGLDPLESAFILPEVKDPKAWFRGELPWGDKERTIFNFLAHAMSPIGINTDLVKYDEIKSYYDLLAPRWKGKIVMNNPVLAGTGFNGFSTMIYSKALELDFFRQLLLNQPVMIEDQRLQIDWLAKAKYSIALWPQTPPMAEYIKAGAPISFIPAPKEGTYVTTGGGALSLVNKAPHPNAARVVINWLLSREGQSFMQNRMQQQSARVDISTEALDATGVRTTGAKYFVSANTIEEWLFTEQDRYREMAKEVFGSLVK